MALCTLPEVKTFIGVAGASFDTLLTDLIKHADDKIKNFTRRKIEADDEVELHDGKMQKSIVLNQSPVVAGAAFEVQEDSEVIDASNYRVDEPAGIVRLLDGQVFFTGELNIQMTYRAGYGSAGQELPIPEDLKITCKKIVAKWFRLRELQGVGSKNFKDGTVNYLHVLDPEIKELLVPHRRELIG